MDGFRGIVSPDGPDPVRSVMANANELGGYGQQLITIVNDIDKRMTETRWTGNDRLEFENNWTSEVKPELESLARSMRAKADELTQLASAQARASAG